MLYLKTVRLHPTNKQEVGRRLARAARHVVYGEEISASGARPVRAQLAPGGATVVLGDFDAPLTVLDARDPSAFELCGAAEGTCRFVRAQLRENGSVFLEDASGSEQMTRVRFCWGDSPLCNLYDAAGLPVGPFEIGISFVATMKGEN